MITKRLLYSLVVLTMLFPSVSVVAAPAQADSPMTIVQSQERVYERQTGGQHYLLRLEMPEVELSPNVAPSDVPATIKPLFTVNGLRWKACSALCKR